MTVAPPLSDRLREQEDALRGMVPAAAFATFARDADALGAAHAGGGLRVGDDAPDFRLPDAEGREFSLAGALAEGPVVVTFFRGTWCPYCNVQLHAYGQALEGIRAAGARLVAVSPQTPAAPEARAEEDRLAFPVLSDAGNAVARRYVPTFWVEGDSREALEGVGVSLSESNGDDAHELPVPGTFVVDREGRVRLAFVEGDFRRRLDPQEILAALRAL